ncbi:MAG: ParB/RepB/Spo0J family partition protein [Patescibacteria group bacterium]
MSKPMGGLGRGLGSLIPQAPTQPVAQTLDNRLQTSEIAEASLRVVDIAPSKIVANPYQPRRTFVQEDLDDLMASIKEHGILQPLVVTEIGDGTYELIAGERRLRASKAIGLATVPVIVREADSKKKLEWALIENIQRQDLNAVEEAIAYKQLMADFGLTQEAVAERVGKSRSQVANTVRLLDLPADIRKALEEGKITRSHARTLLAEENPSRQQELFERMLTGAVTVRTAEAMVQSHTRRAQQAKDPNILEIEKTLREKMGTKVEIKMTTPASGTVVVHFYSKEDLKTLIEHLQ